MNNNKKCRYSVAREKVIEGKCKMHMYRGYFICKIAGELNLNIHITISIF